MPRQPKLTDLQKERLSILEPQLKLAICEKDFNSAKSIVADIQSLLRPTGHIVKLLEIKNWLYELAIELGDYNFAESGFIGNRNILNKNTRLYIESTTLLAICYIRKNEYEKAKPLIQEVLKNEKVIKSERKRIEFHNSIINRFDEEVALYSLKIEKNVRMNLEEIQSEAGKLIISNTVDEIYIILGKALPKQTKDILFQIDEFSKNQLPSAERKLLPSPCDIINDETAGKTVFNSLKRVIYNSLCDPKSEVYKAWFNNGLSIVLEKKFITSAVVAALSGIGIGFPALAISGIALVLRFGLDVYCEHNKPSGIMEKRNQQ